MNIGAVESAIHRARWEPFGDGGLAERAALLLRGLIMDHPFVDGNKRTAYGATAIFLRRNGSELRATGEQVIEATVAIAQDHLSNEEITDWIRENANV